MAHRLKVQCWDVVSECFQSSTAFGIVDFTCKLYSNYEGFYISVR